MSETGCLFCSRSLDNEEIFGKFFHSPLAVHHHCLLFSAGLPQNGDDDEGCSGFLVKDIKKELDRCKRLRCFFCQKNGAHAGCAVKKCRRSYHFACGIENDCIFQFFDKYNSYCPVDRPKQKGDRSSCKAGKSQMPNVEIGGVDSCDCDVEDSSCSICLSPARPVPSFSLIQGPCCRRFYHRKCLQKYGLSSGRHHFKCTLCNNREEFLQECLRLGINLPERDAAWESEHAFDDLLEVHNRCDVVDCLCRKGRDHTDTQGAWRLKRCDGCGQAGAHFKCKGWSQPPNQWHCDDCSASSGTAGSQTFLPFPDERHPGNSQATDFPQSSPDMHSPSMSLARQNGASMPELRQSQLKFAPTTWSSYSTAVESPSPELFSTPSLSSADEQKEKDQAPPISDTSLDRHAVCKQNLPHSSRLFRPPSCRSSLRQVPDRLRPKVKSNEPLKATTTWRHIVQPEDSLSSDEQVCLAPTRKSHSPAFRQTAGRQTSSRNALLCSAGSSRSNHKVVVISDDDSCSSVLQPRCSLLSVVRKRSHMILSSEDEELDGKVNEDAHRIVNTNGRLLRSRRTRISSDTDSSMPEILFEVPARKKSTIPANGRRRRVTVVPESEDSEIEWFPNYPNGFIKRRRKGTIAKIPLSRAGTASRVVVDD